jgi:hypothetical protein
METGEGFVVSAIHPSGVWLAQEALVPSCYPALVGSAALICVGWKVHIIRRRLWKPSHWWTLTHLLMFPAAIVTGVLFTARDGYQPNRSAEVLLDALMYGSVGLCIFWVYWMKGIRLFAAILMATMEIPVLLALFAAGM